MRKLRYLFLILLLDFVVPESNLLYSQNYPFRQYSVSDGLPQSQSSVIYQDSRGFIWISTRNGLSRFDGIEFINYYRKDGLPVNFIQQAVEDPSGHLYASSPLGLSVYDGSKFTFIPPPEDLRIKGFSSAGSFLKDSNSILLLDFQSGGKTRLISFDNGIYKKYSEIFPALDSLHIVEFTYDTLSNSLLILDKYGSLFSWHNNELKRFSGNFFKGITREGNRIIISDSDNKYIYSKLKLYGYERQRGTWIADPIVPVRSEFILYSDGKQFLVKFPFGNFTGWIIDNENNVWIASERNLYRLISTAFSTIDMPDRLFNNIWALAEDKNSHLWFGSLYGDLLEFDGKEYKLRNDYKSLIDREKGFLKGSRKMSDGDIYFSTNAGVFIYNGESFSGVKGIVGLPQVCYIYEDVVDKSVFLGTDLGLYNILEDTVIIYSEFVDAGLGVVEGMVRSDKNKYWLSGHKGLVLFDNKKSFVVNDSILPKSDTYTIDIDKNGGLWVTSEEGLYFKGKDAGRFVHALPEKINSPANTLFMMDSLHLLVGRTTDICIIDIDKFYLRKTDYFRIFDKSDGFSGNDCLDNGIIKDSKGRFLILTSGGVDVLDAGSLKINDSPPRLYVTSIEAVTDSLTWQTVNDPSLFYNQSAELRLNRKQGTLRISYSGISTTNPEKVTYQYRLLGYQKNWSSPVSQRKVVYEKLEPGNYTFQVKAYNADGVGNENPLSVTIRIIPAFWQTMLFKLFIFIIIIAVTVLITWKIINYRQKVKAERNRLQSELSRLHMGSILKQFDPHFTFNVLSSVGSLIIKGEKDVAYDYLLKLSGLLRSVISDGSAIIKPLSEELDFVSRYCEVQKLRFKERFDWSLYVDKNVNLQFEIPKLTIQTFVENAIKHGIEPRITGGRVDISLFNNGTGIEVRIVDDGIGRSKSGKRSVSGTGNGIKIISGIFAQMNIENKEMAILELKDLVDQENKSSGTEVKIFIPDSYHFGFYEKI